MKLFSVCPATIKLRRARKVDNLRVSSVVSYTVFLLFVCLFVFTFFGVAKLLILLVLLIAMCFHTFRPSD